ncbi:MULTISPECIES: FmdB family zinc ribbon protein [Rhodococcus]|nr:MULTISPECIES: zinc ribbon domain-containing protein [Rhodococcus]MCD2141346.1 zinc ribbon domain-containing protein [Rhodococcus pyridinivorans]QQM54216.1 zinc ribbon domain-containing protein [Rhodococcus pyridinivorans]USI91426.1 zinc ribbon domain-containing protein [Rhodococcus pyridinivorans]
MQMPLYEFRCADCGPFDVSVPMSEVSASAPCPRCEQQSRRSLTPPRLGRGGSAAMRLHDATARTASEPDVVSGSLPGVSRRPSRPVTTDPRHRTLPRP